MTQVHPKFGVHPYSLEGADEVACLNWSLGWSIGQEELYSGNFVESMYEASPNGKYTLKCLNKSVDQAVKELLDWCKKNPI